LRQPGFFVTFEGPEGSGKSTQVKALKAWLTQRRIPVVDTFEPGGSELGRSMRRWLLKPGHGLTVEAELLLFLADRAQHVAEVVRPALRKGFVVLCDRYTDSTLAYQGGGRGYPLRFLHRLNLLATGGLRPDLTFLLDLPVEEGMRRATRRSRSDRMERERLAFHKRVRATFRALARQDRHRIAVLDATRPPADVAARVLSVFLPRMSAPLGRLADL
jgi:dTMP kinase